VSGPVGPSGPAGGNRITIPFAFSGDPSSVVGSRLSPTTADTAAYVFANFPLPVTINFETILVRVTNNTMTGNMLLSLMRNDVVVVSNWLTIPAGYVGGLVTSAGVAYAVGDRFSIFLDLTAGGGNVNFSGESQLTP
jgi:hypothetical protein